MRWSRGLGRLQHPAMDEWEFMESPPSQRITGQPMAAGKTLSLVVWPLISAHVPKTAAMNLDGSLEIEGWGGVAQQVKELPLTPDHLGTVLGIHTVKGEK